jgi:hypothetical protein
VSITGQPAQILRALSTPTPSLGKNVAGGYIRQEPSAIHAVAESGSGSGLVFICLPPGGVTIGSSADSMRVVPRTFFGADRQVDYPS